MQKPRFVDAFTKYAEEQPDVLFIALIVLTGLAFIVRWYTPFLHPSTDGEAYLLLARSIAEGRGYRDILLPGEPIAAHFPFGWPLLLSAVYLAFGFTDLAYQAFAWILYLATGVVAYLFGRQFFRPWASYLISFALLSNVLISQYTQTTLAEIPFALFLYGGLLLYIRGERTQKLRYHAGSMLCLVFSTFIKFSGEVLLPALGLTLLVKRKWKLLGILLLFVLLKIGAQYAVQGTEWISRGKITQQQVAATVVRGGDKNAVKTESATLAKLVLFNTRRMLLTYIPHSLFPSVYHLREMSAPKALACAFVSLWIFVGLGFAAFFRGQLFIPLAFCAMLAALLTRVDGPFVFRYYAPVVPLFVFFGLLGIRDSLARLPRSSPLRPTARTSLLALSVVFVIDRPLFVEAAVKQNAFVQRPETVLQFRDVSRCIAERAAPDALLASPLSSTVFVATGHQTLWMPNYDLWEQMWNTDVFASIIGRDSCAYAILPGWWIDNSDYDGAAFDSLLTQRLPHATGKITYGEISPTVLYAPLRSEEATAAFGDVRRCLEVGHRAQTRTEVLVPEVHQPSDSTVSDTGGQVQQAHACSTGRYSPKP